MPLRWNHRDNAGLFQWFDHPFVSVVGLIRQQRLRLQVGQKRICPGQIMNLARGQNDLQWVTQSVGQNVEFAAQTAFASADRLIFTGFFWAPALC